MGRTLIDGADQLLSSSVGRASINTATTGSALITKLIAGTAITLSQTGVDAGTGDVTVNVSLASPPAIGGTTPNSGAFTTLSASSTVSGAGITALHAAPGPIGSTTASTGAFTTLSASSTVSGAGITALHAAPGPIGSTTASTGAFTTLAASSTVSGAGITSLFASPPAIGGTTAAAGSFTALSATSVIFTGNFRQNTAVLSDFGTPAMGVSTSGNQNCIVGQITNNLAANTTSFPTGITGYANVTSSGNYGWGVFGRGDLGTVSTPGNAVGGEFNTFNYAGTPSATLPPQNAVGTTDYAAIALQVAAYGNYPSLIGFAVLNGGGGQPFQYGIYLQAQASTYYSLVLDATSTQGPSSGGALIRSTPSVPNLLLQTMGTSVAANAVLKVIDSGGATKAYLNQGGMGIFTGTPTNDNATAGGLGEYISSGTTAGSAVALTSATPGNVTSISLTAGDWDVSGNVAVVTASGGVLTTVEGWISTTSATLPTMPNAGGATVFQVSFAASSTQQFPVGRIRISLASTTTVYLSANAVFSSGSPSTYGFIGARRRR